MKVAPGQLWRGIGYALTAAWMAGILIVTGSDPAHPWFDYIFVVPLAGWIVGLGIARFVADRRPPSPPPGP
jgi:hypothetical protein